VDAAVDAAAWAFVSWKATTALERGRILARIGQLLRSRAGELAPILTLEQGKPLAEAQTELTSAADNFEWAGEEGKRLCGRIARASVQKCGRPTGKFNHRTGLDSGDGTSVVSLR
jgi:succinate-semialdehyde dehydrogenase/glutarate-semialdehyde dehydrogenase